MPELSDDARATRHLAEVVGEAREQIAYEIRELRRSVDALAAVILIAGENKLDGVSLKSPIGPDYVGETNFVKLVREEFE